MEFGKYLLCERLGEGGMAVVYRAKLLGPGGFEKTLCLKQIRAELAANPQFIDLFVAEAKLTVSLTHANIVPVYELGMVEGTYFLALELVDGPPLAKLVEDGALPPQIAAYVVEQVLRGLDYAHRRGVVHRDLSPGNVLVSRDGEVKIVDFGIAQAGGQMAVAGGSRGYMAPEQEQVGRADARADLYSVGVLLWELVAGRRFDGSPLGIPALAEIVGRATEKDPDARYPDAAQMLSAVARFLRNATAAMTAGELAAHVRARCPDILPARPDDDEDAAGAEASRDEGPAGPRTVPVLRPKQVTFATRIEPPAPRTTLGAAVAAALSLVAGLAGLGALAAFKTPGAERSAAVAAVGRPPARPTVPGGAGATGAAATASPARASARLSVRTVPPGADVRLGERALGQTPLDVEVPAEGGTLRVRKAGFQPVERAVAFAGAPPAAALSLRLEPVGRGRFTLGALPWAHVTIDGKPERDAPFDSLELAAGPHAVTLACPATGRTTRLTITIAPDEAVRYLVDLRGEPKVSKLE